MVLVVSSLEKFTNMLLARLFFYFYNKMMFDRYRWVLLMLVGSFFLLRAYLTLDPDFGWHLRMGQLILTHGIPRTDPFSYTMSSYPFVDHEWLTNVLIAIGYSLVGYRGLAVLFSFLAVFALSYRMYLRQFWDYLFFLLSSMMVTVFIGVRPQIISWVFFVILLKTIVDKKQWDKGKWFLPGFFFLWVNIHGSFPIGLFVLLIAFVVNFWEKRKVFWSDIWVFVLSFLSTFINPYTWRIWWEVWMQMSDTKLHSNIVEWFTALVFVSPSYMLFVACSLVILYQYRARFSLLEKTLAVLSLLLTVSAVRHTPFFAFATLPLLLQGLTRLKISVLKYPGGIQRMRVAYIATGVLVGIAIILEGFMLFGQSMHYPEKSVTYLNTHLSSGNVISVYDWGGYLIWKMPSKKVFVDGRMPSWRWKAPTGESDNAFADFSDVFDGYIPLSRIVNRYNIDTILIPLMSYQALGKENLSIRLSRYIESVLEHKKKPLDIRSEIKQEGFQEIYRDDIAIIFRKIK